MAEFFCLCVYFCSIFFFFNLKGKFLAVYVHFAFYSYLQDERWGYHFEDFLKSIRILGREFWNGNCKLA